MRTNRGCKNLFCFINIVFCASVCCEVKFATTPNVDLIFSQDHLYMQVLEPEDVSYLYRVRPAKNFGGDFTKQHHNIELVPGIPYDGCSELSNSLYLGGTVVLLQRGQCSFVTKTYHAERAGALAVIITDNDISNTDNQIDMVQDGTDRDIAIPSLFLLGKDGFMIKKTLEKYHMSSAVIDIPVNITGISFRTSMQPPWTLW